VQATKPLPGQSSCAHGLFPPSNDIVLSKKTFPMVCFNFLSGIVVIQLNNTITKGLDM